MRILLFLFMSLNLMADIVDPLLLKIHASVFPKIMLLDKDIKNKLNDDKVVLSIVYTSDHKQHALELKRMVDFEYNNRLDSYGFEVRIIDKNQFYSDSESTAYYIFDALELFKDAHLVQDNKLQRIHFGYNYKEVNSNILITLMVKEKVYIYLNRDAKNLASIRFNPIFYKIAKLR